VRGREGQEQDPFYSDASLFEWLTKVPSTEITPQAPLTFTTEAEVDSEKKSRLSHHFVSHKECYQSRQMGDKHWMRPFAVSLTYFPPYIMIDQVCRYGTLLLLHECFQPTHSDISGFEGLLGQEQWYTKGEDMTCCNLI
jgi:hypothetical protein